jgi:LysM repeat protein
MQKTDILKLGRKLKVGVVGNTTHTSGSAGSQAQYHTIVSGDTLGALAIKYKTTVKKICQLNGITETTILKLGKKLRVK